MKNKAYDLATYAFQKDEPLLLDTNVWLYLFPAPSKAVPRFAAIYSSALKAMLRARAHLAMDAFVLSEYLNVYWRIEWKALHMRQYPEPKDFRKSPDFTPVGASAVIFASRIVAMCRAYDHPFRTTNLAQLLADFEAGTNDFNDGLLAETCRHHGWKLVTNDSDFTTGGIEVLTSHPVLLKACP